MRNVNGVLFLDKVSGVSSAYLLHQVKIIFQAKKAGHIGTLDPIATGMLPICFGEATKFSRYFLSSDKSYRVLAKFGERTDTFDSSGKVICICPVKLSDISLCQALSVFVGKTYQVPPMFSALKRFGYPLYKYARRGIHITRPSRLINIYNINLIRWDGKYLELEVFCSKGTYIRSFINDLGEYLGCGAHVIALRRYSVAYCNSELMINISVLQRYNSSMVGIELFKKLDGLLYPVDIILRHLPIVTVSEETYRLLRCGQKVKINNKVVIPYDITNTRLVRMIVGQAGEFFGVGKIIEDGKYLLVDRLLIA